MKRLKTENPAVAQEIIEACLGLDAPAILRSRGIVSSFASYELGSGAGGCEVAGAYLCDFKANRHGYPFQMHANECVSYIETCEHR